MEIHPDTPWGLRVALQLVEFAPRGKNVLLGGGASIAHSWACWFFTERESMFLSSGQKRTAKAIARDRWNLVNRDFGSKSIEERKRIAIEQVEEDLFHMRRGPIGNKKGFGSVFTSIIISLMIRLAMKWIERWAEKKLLEVLDEI